MRSAICNINFKPPAASSTDAQVTTARMMSITSIGAFPTGIRNTKTSIARPIPDTTPNPIPP